MSNELEDLASDIKSLSTDDQTRLRAAIPGWGDIPQGVADRMSGWQLMVVLVLSLGVLVGVFLVLLFVGIDLLRDSTPAKDFTQTANTMIGAAIGMVVGGAGATAATNAIQKR